jgi:hypothetical protein
MTRDDALMLADGVLAATVGAYAQRLRATGRAEGLSEEMIEAAIESALRFTLRERARLRGQIAGIFDAIDRETTS